jgi:Outer membrane protein beta-barrel domain
MNLRHVWKAPLVLFLLVVASATASAQTFITPYIGSSFNSTFDDYDFGTKLHYGAALTWLGTGGIGVEVDFGYAPTFFEPGEDEFFDLESEGSVTTLMGNVVFGGGSGLYASGGLGLMRSRIEAIGDLFEFSDNGFGMNVGGGLRIGSKGFGVKGDLRYFRQLSELGLFNNIELGDFSFWRASVGASIGF